MVRVKEEPVAIACAGVAEDDAVGPKPLVGLGLHGRHEARGLEDGVVSGAPDMARRQLDEAVEGVNEGH